MGDSEENTELSVNMQLTRIFEEILAYYKLDKEPHRARAFTNAIDFVREHPTIITSGKEFVKQYKGVGKSVAAEIDEYIKIGTTQRVEALRDKHKDIYRLQKELETHNVYGIGPATIIKLHKAGVEKLSDLKKPKYYDKLTHAQQLGVTYMEDINTRIPRAEMKQINDELKTVLDGLTWSITGSFRRKEPDSGDIDILFRGKNMESYDIVKILKKNKLIVGDLAIGKNSYRGLIKLDPESIVHRLDILVIPPESYAYALLYFTGSQRFNILMRARALEFGLTLNEKTMSDLNDEDDTYEAETERDIFDLLEVEYLKPKDRIRNLDRLDTYSDGGDESD